MVIILFAHNTVHKNIITNTGLLIITVIITTETRAARRDTFIITTETRATRRDTFIITIQRQGQLVEIRDEVM